MHNTAQTLRILGKTIKTSRSQPFRPYRLYPIPHNSKFLQNSRVPLHTETRILTLCAQAIVAKDESDVERTLADLRAALREHIQHAKTALAAQATAIAEIGKSPEIAPTEGH